MALDAKWYTVVDKHIKALNDGSLSEEERAEAAKELASLAFSDSTNERMNRQNLIVDGGAAVPLVGIMLHGTTETERWWASLALVQLTYGNERTIQKLVDVSILGDTSRVVKRWMIGDVAVEDELVENQDRECLVRAASKVLANEVAYATDRIKYGALHILTNIANKCWDIHDLIFIHGAIRRVVPLCKSSNTPALVAAGVALLCSMSYREGSRSKLIKAGCVRVLDPIARSERADLNSVSANIAKTNLRRHAATVMAALARGYFDRKRLKKEAQARKMKRLARFFSNLVFYKCFVIWVHFAREAVEHREKMKMSVKRLLNRSLVSALQRLTKYVDHRHGKYDKLDRAIAFAGKSLVARNHMVGMWKEYMRKEGSWWTPDSDMEEQVKKRCSSFMALMSGQWMSLCFQEWKTVLAKKKRAMKRWHNATIYYGFTSWTEYMYHEGAWWEPDGELKKLLDEKCGRFLAAMSGNYLQSSFREWSNLIRKKKRAKQRWLNRCLTNTFDQWHDVVFVDAYELYEQVAIKCSKVLALISGEKLSVCFRSWHEHTVKMSRSKRFLLTIKNKPLRIGWDAWIDFMCQGTWWEPDDTMQAQLENKCGHLISMMRGDFTRMVLHEWHLVAHKSRKSMMRWKNQTLFHQWKSWVEYHIQEGADRRRTAIIRAKRKTATMRENLWEWVSCTDERLYRRSLVGDAILMWLNWRVIWAFRSLDGNCQLEKYHRYVLDRFKNRYKMRPANRCLLALAQYVSRQKHLRFIMHRIKNKALVDCVSKWLEAVKEARIEARERMVSKSQLLMRWLKRPMILCHSAWREYVTEQVRNRLILKKMKYRLDNGCVFETFHNWNLFVEIMVQERFHVLKAAVADSLRTGTLSLLLVSLRREQSLFHRSNVRWNDFAKTYMEDALTEFSAEEAHEVDNLYKRIRARKAMRNKAYHEQLESFEYASQWKVPLARRNAQTKTNSPSPPRGRFEAGHASSPAPNVAEANGRKADVNAPSFTERKLQIMPAYMARSGDLRGMAMAEDLRREGRHMRHQLQAKERRFKDERSKAARIAARQANKGNDMGSDAAGQQVPGMLEKPGSAPPSARRMAAEHDAARSLRDAQKLFSKLDSPAAIAWNESQKSQATLEYQGELRQPGTGLLPDILLAKDEGDWPWVDKKAVSFVLGVDEGFSLPRLVPQRTAIIL